MSNDENIHYDETIKYADDEYDARKKIKKFTVDLIPTLNRAVIQSAFICKKPLTFAIKYDKKSSALHFQLDSNNSIIRDRTVQVQMYRNLETCRFARLFFDMETISSEGIDYRCKYRGVQPLYERYLIQFSRENYDYQMNDRGKPSQNYMRVFGWKLQDSDNDLLFYYVQRKCYNDATRTNIVRSAGLQLATKRGLEYLDKYSNSADVAIRRVNKTDDVPFFAKDDGTFEEVVMHDVEEDSDE